MKKDKTKADEATENKKKTINNEDSGIDSSVNDGAVKNTEKEKKSVTKVGSLLKAMRQQKGLKLPDISKRLCIRKLYLEAIEESNYKEIPAFPYGIGFIRSYADFLGLNGSNIVDLYKEETNTKPEQDIYVLEPQSEASVPNKWSLVISLVAIILIYGLWHWYNKNLNKETEVVEQSESIKNDAGDVYNEELPIVVEDFVAKSDTENVSNIQNDNFEKEIINVETPAENEQITITETSFNENAINEVKPQNNEAVTVEEENEVEVETRKGVILKIKDESWIEIKNDRTLYISKVLQAGDEYVVPEGGRGMILSIGKVNGVDVYINGKLVKVTKPNKKTNIALDPFLAAN